MIPYFRQIFGFYCLIHFIQLLPYAQELFDLNNMSYDSKLGPTFLLFPNIIHFIGPELLLIILIFFSITFIINILPRTSSAIICYGWAAMLNTNVLIYNPGIPYIGWLLLIMSIDPECKNPYFYWFSWFLTNINYTISGIHKLQCPSWIDGTALIYIISSPLARDNCFRNLLWKAPILFLKISNWLALMLEIFSLPLGTFKYTRFWFWIMHIVFHLVILLVINFSDLTIGMMMIHFYLFDKKWIAMYFSKLKLKLK